MLATGGPVRYPEIWGKAGKTRANPEKAFHRESLLAAGEVQRIVECQDELRRRHLGSDGRLRVSHPFGKSQNELSLVDVLGNID